MIRQIIVIKIISIIQSLWDCLEENNCYNFHLCAVMCAHFMIFSFPFFRIELIVILTSKGIKEQETPGVTITPTVEYEQVISSSKQTIFSNLN